MVTVLFEMMVLLFGGIGYGLVTAVTVVGIQRQSLQDNLRGILVNIMQGTARPYG